MISFSPETLGFFFFSLSSEIKKNRERASSECASIDLMRCAFDAYVPTIIDVLPVFHRPSAYRRPVVRTPYSPMSCTIMDGRLRLWHDDDGDVEDLLL